MTRGLYPFSQVKARGKELQLGDVSILKDATQFTFAIPWKNKYFAISVGTMANSRHEWHGACITPFRRRELNPLQGVQAMTQVIYKSRRTAPVAQPAERPDPAVAATLRDMAFVLRMTKKVKDSIMDCKPLTSASKA